MKAHPSAEALASSTPVSPSIQENVEWVSKVLGNPEDLVVRLIPSPDEPCQAVMFISGLADAPSIRRHIVEPLLGLSSGHQRVHSVIDALTEPKISSHDNLEQLVSALLAGNTAIFSAGETKGSSASTPGWALRPIRDAGEKTIRGPREGFTETLEQNVAMIRRWIRDPKLRVEHTHIGARTQTEVAVLFLEDVANPTVVAEVRKRLGHIDIDGILESGYLEQLIKDKRTTIFPLTQSTERSDKVAAGVLEGRVAILVDKSPFALIVPVTVNELYQSSEDYYFDFWLGSFLRLIRLLGNNLAIVLPGLYVALVGVNPEMLPTRLVFNIAASRLGVPFPIVVEVLLIELTIEVFREAGLRLPSPIAQTLGVVAGVTLGIAAVQVGIVSNSTLIVSVITAIASFSGPDYSVGIAWRLLKFLLIIGAATTGLFGLTFFGLFIIAHMATLQSFGVSYLAPWAPLEPKALADGPFRAPLWWRIHRPETYRPTDRDRMGGTREENDE